MNQQTKYPGQTTF